MNRLENDKDQILSIGKHGVRITVARDGMSLPKSSIPRSPDQWGFNENESSKKKGKRYQE